MKLKNLTLPKAVPLPRAPLTHKNFAEQVANFLNHDFARHGWELPGLIALPRSDSRTATGRANIRKSHARLRALVMPALDAFAEGRTGAPEFEKMVFAFNEIVGNPFCFERKVVNGKLSDKWERRLGRTLRIDSVYDNYVARLAELFDANKLDHLARCRHCGMFFVTAGRGKPAIWAPGHRNDVANEQLRRRGYFKEKYRERIGNELAIAKKFWRKGLRGDTLLDRLKKERLRAGKKPYLGKTLLKRNRLWS